jgi:hypothetical protein
VSIINFLGIQSQSLFKNLSIFQKLLKFLNLKSFTKEAIYIKEEGYEAQFSA